MKWRGWFSPLAGPRRRGKVAVLLLAMGVFTSASISMVWTRLQSIELGYKISKSSQERARLLEINRQLRIEAALLKRPERIHQIATEELGLRQPRPDQVRRLRRRPASRRVQ